MPAAISPIWAELAAVLKAHGVHNYSIYLDPATRQLYGYVEIEDEARWQAIAQTEVLQALVEAHCATSCQATRTTARYPRNLSKSSTWISHPHASTENVPVPPVSARRRDHHRPTAGDTTRRFHRH